MDLVIFNGVLNLVPDKSVAYSEVLRVLKPGGRFLYGDIIVGSELSDVDSKEHRFVDWLNRTKKWGREPPCGNCGKHCSMLRAAATLMSS